MPSCLRSGPGDFFKDTIETRRIPFGTKGALRCRAGGDETLRLYRSTGGNSAAMGKEVGRGGDGRERGTGERGERARVRERGREERREGER